MYTLAMESTAASASADRCSALPCPNWCETSAGRAETRTVKKVSDAATRSVPEWTASEIIPRLCVARPAASFSTTRPAAATTDTSAARRCGVISSYASAATARRAYAETDGRGASGIYRLPRSACSRSIASNSALKLPSPNPRAPWRSITSKNRVGRSWAVFVKICSR